MLPVCQPSPITPIVLVLLMLPVSLLAVWALLTALSVRAQSEVLTYEVSTTSSFRPEIPSDKVDTTEWTHSLPTSLAVQTCPLGLFKCLLATSRSNQVDSAGAHFMCLDRARVCDGVTDCPLGEDESRSECAGQSAGCYLCKSTQPPQCIAMSRVCDRKCDCPRGDDESPSLCLNISLPSGALLDSRFFSNQLGQTNINIVNKDSGNVGREERPNSRPDYRQSGGKQGRTVGYDSGGSVQEGIGFMFRVDNFVIYNSEVKMFNQESENVGPPNGTRLADRHPLQPYLARTNSIRPQ